MKPLIIIHGWSDAASSFQGLANHIAEAGQRDIHLINLANYISMDDSIFMDDLVVCLQRAWQRHNLPLDPFSVDVIVHSTGALIIRDWITRYFTPTTVPIKHLLMLAPANFGSPLAQKGRALIGRIIEGMHSRKLFETGSHILKALEIASPYTWQLAQKDRFGRYNFYGPGRILCTVLVGNQGYSGIRAAANEPGTDGTVRLSTANMNASQLEVDFHLDPSKPYYRFKKSRGITAFAVMAGENHSTIAGKEGGPINQQTLPHILQSLAVTDDDFNAWCKQLDSDTTTVMAQHDTTLATQGFQNTVCRLQDQFERLIADYFIEFYAGVDHDWLSAHFHADIIQSVHAYGDEPCYRSLLVNCSLIKKLLISQDLPQLKMSLSAHPQFTDQQLVGYQTADKTHFGAIELDRRILRKLFQQNRTLLMSIKIKRQQDDKLFDIINAH